MASTQIPKSADALISLATDAADGAATQGPTIGITAVNEAGDGALSATGTIIVP
jgi:hypothetical protein